MRLSIEQELLNKAVNYIATKPFHEVFQLINEIQNDIKPIEKRKKLKKKQKKNNCVWWYNDIRVV